MAVRDEEGEAYSPYETYLAQIATLRRDVLATGWPPEEELQKEGRGAITRLTGEEAKTHSLAEIYLKIWDDVLHYREPDWMDLSPVEILEVKYISAKKAGGKGREELMELAAFHSPPLETGILARASQALRRR